MKKLFASSIVLLLFMGACDICGDPEPYFDIEGVKIQYLPPYSDLNQDSIPYDMFALNVVFQTKYYGSVPINRFSLTPTAHAHSCADPGYKGTKEKIEKIEIVALGDFNNNFKTGDLLNPVILLNNQTIENFIGIQNQHGLSNQFLEFRLTQRPDSTVKQAFRINLKLTNGEEYTAESKAILIN